MARPRRYKDGKPFSVRFDQETIDALQERAAHLGIDRSQLINKLITKHLRENPFIDDEEPGEQMQAAEDPTKYKANAEDDRAS